MVANADYFKDLVVDISGTGADFVAVIDGLYGPALPDKDANQWLDDDILDFVTLVSGSLDETCEAAVGQSAECIDPYVLMRLDELFPLLSQALEPPPPPPVGDEDLPF